MQGNRYIVPILWKISYPFSTFYYEKWFLTIAHKIVVWTYFYFGENGWCHTYYYFTFMGRYRTYIISCCTSVYDEYAKTRVCYLKISKVTQALDIHLFNICRYSLITAHCCTHIQRFFISAFCSLIVVVDKNKNDVITSSDA